MTIAERIAAAIKEKKITQKAVAETVGVKPSTVNTWFKVNADSIPSSYILPLCELLDMQPEELLCGAPRKDIIEAIPDGYVELSEHERHLIDLFRDLDWIGQNVVLNSAIMEVRSKAAQGNDATATSKENMG